MSINMLDVVKARLNRSSAPGQFVLTGSARHESLPRAAQALTGRLQQLPVLPLSQAELEGSPRNLLEVLLETPGAAISTRESITTRLGSRSHQEIKPATRVSGHDLKGLVNLRDHEGDSFTAGVEFYTGTRSYTYDDRLLVLPIDQLWSTS